MTTFNVKYLKTISSELQLQVQLTTEEVEEFNSDELTEMAGWTSFSTASPRVMAFILPKKISTFNLATCKWLLALAHARKNVTFAPGENVRSYAESKKLPTLFTPTTVTVGDENLKVSLVVTKEDLSVPRQRMIALLASFYKHDGVQWQCAIAQKFFHSKAYKSLKPEGPGFFSKILNGLFDRVPHTVRHSSELLSFFTREFSAMEANDIILMTRFLSTEMLHLYPVKKNADGRILLSPGDHSHPFEYIQSDIEKPVFSRPLDTTHKEYVGTNLIHVLNASCQTNQIWKKTLPEAIAIGSGSIALPTEQQALLETVASVALCHDRIHLVNFPTSLQEKMVATASFWEKKVTMVVSSDRLIQAPATVRPFLVTTIPEGSVEIAISDIDLVQPVIPKGVTQTTALASYRDSVMASMLERESLIPPNGYLIGRLLPISPDVKIYTVRWPYDAFGIFSRNRELQRVLSEDGVRKVGPTPVPQLSIAQFYAEVMKACNLVSQQFAAPFIGREFRYANLVKVPEEKASLIKIDAKVAQKGIIGYETLLSAPDVGSPVVIQQDLRQKKKKRKNAAQVEESLQKADRMQRAEVRQDAIVAPFISPVHRTDEPHPLSSTEVVGPRPPAVLSPLATVPISVPIVPQDSTSDDSPAHRARMAKKVQLEQAARELESEGGDDNGGASEEEPPIFDLFSPTLAGDIDPTNV